MSKNKKTLYIKNELKEKIDKLAQNRNTSFNGTVINILNNFFKDKDSDASP